MDWLISFVCVQQKSHFNFLISGLPIKKSKTSCDELMKKMSTWNCSKHYLFTVNNSRDEYDYGDWLPTLSDFQLIVN